MICWISELAGEPPSEVRRKLIAEEYGCGANVREEMAARGIQPFEMSKELTEFYSATSAFLFESTVWNRTPEKLRMREWIGHRLASAGRPLRILVYGDGPGWDSAHLAGCGHEVTYFEVGELNTGFAARLFSHLQLDVAFADIQMLESESFDAIVCLDVLEHVPDPKAVTRNFYRWLRPGGVLVTSAPFFLLSPDYPTHLRSNRRFSGCIRSLYGKAGFRLFDGRPFWNPLILAKAGDLLLSPGSAGSRISIRMIGAILRCGQVCSGPLASLTRLIVTSDPKWRKELEQTSELEL